MMLCKKPGFVGARKRSTASWFRPDAIGILKSAVLVSIRDRPQELAEVRREDDDVVGLVIDRHDLPEDATLKRSQVDSDAGRILRADQLDVVAVEARGADALVYLVRILLGHVAIPQRVLDDLLDAEQPTPRRELDLLGAESEPRDDRVAGEPAEVGRTFRFLAVDAPQELDEIVIQGDAQSHLGLPDGFFLYRAAKPRIGRWIKLCQRREEIACNCHHCFHSFNLP